MLIELEQREGLATKRQPWAGSLLLSPALQEGEERVAVMTGVAGLEAEAGLTESSEPGK